MTRPLFIRTRPRRLVQILAGLVLVLLASLVVGLVAGIVAGLASLLA